MTSDVEREFVEDMGRLSFDPLAWVYYSFPWGEAGTSLSDHDGPDVWQIEVLSAIRDGLLTPDEAILLATSSGHGIGKSSLVSWLILWALSTFPDTRGVVTANTATQLRSKTWAELTKWHNLFVLKHWFSVTATAIFSSDPAHEKTWRVDAIPWSKNNTEAFAGLHNQGKRILVVFDEASAIDDPVWEVTEGALTDTGTEIIWAVFGNPTRNTGRFADCFRKYKHRWKRFQVDSRSARMTNKAQIAQWIEDYGEDSDFVKVRVRGIFPSASSLQLIPLDIVDAAFARHESLAHESHSFTAKVLGVDVARYGDDRSAIFLRQGLRSELVWQGSKVDTMTTANIVAQFEDQLGTAATFIDVGAMGSGVIDKLRELGRHPIEINFASKPFDPRFANKRAEMWSNMADWLRQGGTLPSRDKNNKAVRDDLRDDLCAPEYGFTTSGKLLLESKEEMKKRGLASPDLADALALTFAAPVRVQERTSSEMICDI